MPPAVGEYLRSAGTLGIRYDNGLTAMQEAGKSAAFLSVAYLAVCRVDKWAA